jgi:hypothetical protein
MSLPPPRTFVTQLLASIPKLAPQAAPTVPGIPSNSPLHSASEPVKKQLMTLHVLFPNEFLAALDLLDRRLVTRFRIRPLPEDAAPQGEALAEDARTLSGFSELGDAVAWESGGMMSAPEVLMRDADTEAGSLFPRISERDDSEFLRKDIDVAQQHRPEDAVREAEVMDTVYYVRSAQQKPSRYSTSYDSTASYEVRLRSWNCSCPAFAFNAFPGVYSESPVADVGSLRAPDVDVEGVMEGDRSWIFGGLSLGDAMPPVCKHLLACVLVERCALFVTYVEEKEVSLEEAVAWAAGWGD